jgi:hypothetical protein
VPFGGDRQTSSAAPDVQDGLAGLNTRQREQPGPESPFATPRDHPDQQVVAKGMVENASGSLRHTSSVDWIVCQEKNTRSHIVPNRTSPRVLSRKSVTDRRVQKTQHSLHEALIGLVREKDCEETISTGATAR